MKHAAAKNASIVYGRRLRGAAKAGRSGAVPRKHRRRSWTSEHGAEWLKANHATEGRASPPRRFKRVSGKVYGPFKGPGSTP